MQTLYLVEERPSPSTDFFLLPAIASDQRATPLQVVHRGFDQVPPLHALTDAEIIFVRYLPSGWVRALSRGRCRPRRLVLFIDDDLLDLSAWAGTPWHYRWKLLWLARRHRRWLERRLEAGTATLWVGSAALQRKYAHWHPVLLRPRPHPPGWAAPILRQPQPTSRQESLAPTEPVIRVFYHGSASHQPEHAWLQKLMRRLLATDSAISFEVIADRALAKGYLGLPRTQIIPPMAWPSYRLFIERPGRHIGLAPLLPSAFNAARSYTKFFDITAAGAVGLYPRGSVYETICTHQQDGLLLPLDLERWVAEIRALAADSSRRQRMLSKALEKVQTARTSATL